MSKLGESAGLSMGLATACAALAAWVGPYALDRFEDASELSAARDCVELVLEGTEDPSVCTPPDVNATPDELGRLDNEMRGEQYGNYILGGAAGLAALALAGCALGGTGKAVWIVWRRRSDESSEEPKA